MTGRDLIVYILENKLEDAPVFKDGKLLGFMNVEEAAVKYEVGIATVKLWFRLGMLRGIVIGEEIYIPADTDKPKTNIDWTETTTVL
jgi:hypothetical protein